jgi:ABC-type Na+ efflux pump permease subunit
MQQCIDAIFQERRHVSAPLFARRQHAPEAFLPAIAPVAASALRHFAVDHHLAPLQLVIFLFFSGMLAAGAVAQEKDRKTLLLTRMSNTELVLGKLLSSMLMVLVLLVTVMAGKNVSGVVDYRFNLCHVARILGSGFCRNFGKNLVQFADA